MTGLGALTARHGLLYGADYNPEQWPREVWRADVDLMRAAGVNLVTVGVFSWAALEPAPGRYDWSWLDEVLDLVHAAGISVDLATPTASPPPWLHHLDPTSSAVDDRGTRMSPGSRNHFCPGSPVYREQVRAVVSALVDRYADHPAVALWHVGNELGQTCFCDLCAQRFRSWLADRYGDVDALNRAWGTAVWSQRYRDLDEVLPPRAVPYLHNPSQRLDFLRFTSGQLREVYRLQAEVVRARSAAPVTTNFMGFFRGVDQHTWADDLDVVADDCYTDPADPSSPARAALAHDLVRGVGAGRPWLLMEQAASTVSWRTHNVPKPPGGLLRDSLRAVAHGADGVCYFQWRASTAGPEQFHSALLPHAGADTYLHRSVRAQGAALARLGSVVGSRVEARVALVFDWPSWWAGELPGRPSAGLDVLRQLEAYHEPFWRAGVATDVVPPSADLDGYDLVVVPALQLVSDDDAANVAQVPERGGVLLVGPFTAVCDEHGHVRPGRFPAPWRDVLGVSGEDWRPLPDGGAGVRSAVLGDFTATVWSELLHDEGADVLAAYDGSGDEALAGRPAVTRRAVGPGSAWYVSTVPPAAVLTAVVADCLAAAGVGPPLGEVPPDVEVACRGDAVVLLNAAAVARPVSVPWPAVDLLTGAAVDGVARLGAGGCAVLVPRWKPGVT